MQEFSIHRCTRRCRTSDRRLEPNERYYSVVTKKVSQTVRYDIAACEWTGPPENAIAWWQAVMPDRKPAVAIPTPNAVLLSRLSELCDDPAQEVLAYLLAMLLVRRKKLEIVPPAGLLQQTETMVSLTSVDDGQQFSVYEPDESVMGMAVQVHQQILMDMLVQDSQEASTETENAETENEDAA